MPELVISAPAEQAAGDQPEAALQQIEVKFDDFQEFVEHAAPHLSESAVFLETESVLPPGTAVRLELGLREGTVLIRALGQVAVAPAGSQSGQSEQPSWEMEVDNLLSEVLPEGEKPPPENGGSPGIIHTAGDEPVFLGETSGGWTEGTAEDDAAPAAGTAAEEEPVFLGETSERWTEGPPEEAGTAAPRTAVAGTPAAGAPAGAGAGDEPVFLGETSGGWTEGSFPSDQEAVQETTPPIPEDVAQALEDVAPELEDVPPALEDVPPALEDAPPEFEDVSPALEVTPPAPDFVPPAPEVTSPSLDGGFSTAAGREAGGRDSWTASAENLPLSTPPVEPAESAELLPAIDLDSEPRPGGAAGRRAGTTSPVDASMMLDREVTLAGAEDPDSLVLGFGKSITMAPPKRRSAALPLFLLVLGLGAAGLFVFYRSGRPRGPTPSPRRSLARARRLPPPPRQRARDPPLAARPRRLPAADRTQRSRDRRRSRRPHRPPSPRLPRHRSLLPRRRSRLPRRRSRLPRRRSRSRRWRRALLPPRPRPIPQLPPRTRIRCRPPRPRCAAGPRPGRPSGSRTTSLTTPAGYSPPGLSRKAWEEQRRVRIQVPKQIDVRVEQIEVEILDPSRVRARFLQRYSTESRNLRTRKSMEIVREPAGWKIVSEQIDR